MAQLGRRGPAVTGQGVQVLPEHGFQSDGAETAGAGVADAPRLPHGARGFKTGQRLPEAHGVGAADSPPARLGKMFRPAGRNLTRGAEQGGIAGAARTPQPSRRCRE